MAQTRNACNIRKNRTTRRARNLALILALLPGLYAGASLAEPVSFKRDLVPLFQRQCVACHMTGDEQGNLGLMPKLAYASLVGKDARQGKMPRVAPGEPERSYLLHKLRGTHLDHGGSGGRMPMGQGPLSEDQVGQVRAWIEAGAPNN